MHKFLFTTVLSVLTLSTWAASSSSSMPSSSQSSAEQDNVIKNMQATLAKMQRFADRATQYSPIQARDTLNKMHIWENDLHLTIGAPLKHMKSSIANEPYKSIMDKITVQIQRVSDQVQSK